MMLDNIFERLYSKCQKDLIVVTLTAWTRTYKFTPTMKDKIKYTFLYGRKRGPPTTLNLLISYNKSKFSKTNVIISKTTLKRVIVNSAVSINFTLFHRAMNADYLDKMHN